MDIGIIIWIAIVVVSLIIEWITSEAFMIWFAAGGLVSVVISVLGLDLLTAGIAFIVISIAALVTFRARVRRKKPFAKMNAYNAYDKDFVLLTDITRFEAGTIKIGDVVWSVVTEKSGEIVPAGTLVKAIKLEGNKYIVRPVIKDSDNKYIVEPTAPKGNKYAVEQGEFDEYSVQAVACKQPKVKKQKNKVKKAKKERKPFGQTKFALFFKKIGSGIKGLFVKMAEKARANKAKRVEARQERIRKERAKKPTKKIIRRVVVKKVVKQPVQENEQAQTVTTEKVAK